MPRHLPLACTLALVIGPAPIAAQGADTATTLPDLRVIRAPLSVGSAGLAVTIIGGEGIGRGDPQPDLARALGEVPGVVARDRGDRSLDQLLAIRGAGARANFGVRGVRVLVDGIPATLPDGQTPLTSLDLDLAERIEVVRGPLAALHGNGSEGVVSITTRLRFPGPFGGRVGSMTGTGNALDSWLQVGGGGAALGGLLAVSRRRTDGLREHAASEQWRMRGSALWQVTPEASLTLTLSHADDPMLESPGALTLDEWRKDPEAASPTSVLRDAGKSLRQDQLGLGWEVSRPGLRAEVHGWLLRRELENPIAAPAPQPAAPTEGVWIGIDRRVAGLRGSLSGLLGSTILATGGFDLQGQRDDRVNRHHDAGIPFGPVDLDQRETTSAFGVFTQFAVPLADGVTARVGGRHDRTGFAVDDHLDPGAGGQRSMSAWSGDAAVALARPGHELWAGMATAFETPTTTELANRGDGGTGLNRELDPARTVSVELGSRVRHDGARLEVVGYRATTHDAIAPVSELGGRSVYANIGTTHRTGLEVSGRTPLGGTTVARLSAAWIDARFGAGAVDASGASVRGNRIPGIPSFTARAGVATASGPVRIDLEQAWSSDIRADDANGITVPGWGAGITDVTVQWQPATRLVLHLIVTNLLDRDHVAAVVVNGGFGRVVQPGAGRTIRLGGEWRFGSGDSLRER